MMGTVTQGNDGDTYYLQKDGGIGDKDADPYVCQGGAAAITDQDSTIGGIMTVGDLNWEKGNYITYQVKETTGGEIEVEIDTDSD